MPHLVKFGEGTNREVEGQGPLIHEAKATNNPDLQIATLSHFGWTHTSSSTPDHHLSHILKLWRSNCVILGSYSFCNFDNGLQPSLSILLLSLSMSYILCSNLDNTQEVCMPPTSFPTTFLPSWHRYFLIFWGEGGFQDFHSRNWDAISRRQTDIFG